MEDMFLVGLLLPFSPKLKLIIEISSRCGCIPQYHRCRCGNKTLKPRAEPSVRLKIGEPFKRGALANIACLHWREWVHDNGRFSTRRGEVYKLLRSVVAKWFWSWSVSICDRLQ